MNEKNIKLLEEIRISLIWGEKVVSKQNFKNLNDK